MPIPYPDMEKLKRQSIMNACSEVEGEHFNLGKKICVPRDLMMEELKLLSNRGSRMFQERLRRVEKFTLENVKTETHPCLLEHKGTQSSSGSRGDHENYGSQVGITLPEKTCLLHTLKQTVARKGNPNLLAPGYSGPLPEVPHERFNITVIPKSYCSPWRMQHNNSDDVVASISANLPELPTKLNPDNYRCFNRAPTPFLGTVGTERTFPLPWFELNQAHTESNRTWERICDRPNFNRTPRGWIAQYAAETMDL